MSTYNVPLSWGLCSSKGYGFSAVLDINRVSMVINRVWFIHSSLDMGMFLRSHFFNIIEKKINTEKPSTNYVYENLILV